MKQISLLIIVLAAFFSSCDGSKEKVKMTVASEKRAAVGVDDMEVLLVKEGDNAEWTYFYSTIEGFNYEPGYEYVLDVRKEKIKEPVPADASSVRYTLVKELSKTKKTSESMPAKPKRKPEAVNVTMTIASAKKKAEGTAPKEVFQVKEGNNTEWTNFHSTIEGFNYEPGYEYVLEVKKEALDEPVPADASSFKYTLVREISKTKKKSEGIK